MAIRCEIKKHIADINTETGLELNIVSWNDREAKLDLRRWDKRDGEPRAMKGITLSASEASALSRALTEYLKEAANEI